MNSSVIALPEPPRGRPFWGGGVHRNGGLRVLALQLVYRDPGYPHRTAKSQKGLPIARFPDQIPDPCAHGVRKICSREVYARILNKKYDKV